MSTFIHGGSALTLDIGAKAHAALSRGDVVMLDPLAAGDGYTTKLVIIDSALGQLAPYGVVLGTAGKSTFATGEDVLIRIVGTCDVLFAVAGDSVAGQAVKLVLNQKYAVGTGSTAHVPTTTANRLLGIAHIASTPASGQLGSCYINGLTLFG
jgi:archaellum biogenesis ATPase FlaH